MGQGSPKVVLYLPCNCTFPGRVVHVSRQQQPQSDPLPFLQSSRVLSCCLLLVSLSDSARRVRFLLLHHLLLLVLRAMNDNRQIAHVNHGLSHTCTYLAAAVYVIMYVALIAWLRIAAHPTLML